jgi:hypothetical protein
MLRFSRFSLFCGLFVLALLGQAAPVHAHPHVWVDYYVDEVGGKGGITKLKFRWHFDDMFTSMVREDFHVKSITPETVKQLRDGAFANLKNYHYYIYAKLDGKSFEPTEISDFDAKMKGKNLEYTFTIMLPQPAHKVELSLYDPEFYVDIGPPLQPASPDSPGIMASAKMLPMDFVSASAEDGARPPVCENHQGEPRTSAMWGKFALFVVNCTAQP